MAKAKKVDVWLVGTYPCEYRLYGGNKPRLTKHGRWPKNRKYIWLDEGDRRCVFPDVHVEPWGGPVKVG